MYFIEEGIHRPSHARRGVQYGPLIPLTVGGVARCFHMAGIFIFARKIVTALVGNVCRTTKLSDVLGLGLLSRPIKSSCFYQSFGLLSDFRSRCTLSWPPSPSECTGERKTFNAVVYIDRWSPFNARRHHRSTLGHGACRMPTEWSAPPVGNEGGNKTHAALRSILRLRSRGSTRWNGGRNQLQWRRRCIPCKDGFIQWLHVTRGATLFVGSIMGHFNNNMALRHGRF